MNLSKLLVAAQASALALVVAGCGGGGGGDGNGDDPPTTRTPPPAGGPTTPPTASEPAAVALPSNIPAGMTPGDGTYEIAAGASQTVNGVTFSCAADGAACEVTVASGRATSTGGTVTAALSPAAVAQIALQDSQMKMDEAAAKKAATDLTKAIAATTMPGVAEVSDTPPVTGANAVNTTRIPSFGPTGSETGLIRLKKGDSVGSLGNWKGVDYAGTHGAGEAKTYGMARVYSNAEASKNVSFVSEAGRAVHMLSDSTPGDSKDIFDVTADAFATPYASKHIAGADFPVSGTKTYTTNAERSFAGTFRKAPGTYECTGATCTAAVSGADQDQITLTGSWTFAPSAGAMVEAADGKYLHFGWWARKDYLEVPRHAGVFYGATTDTTVVDENVINTASLVGKVTYTGSAAGKYAITGALRPATDASGHFTADAELVADFKATAASSTLSGTIDAFRLNDGSSDPGWSVKLQKTAFAGDDDKFMTDDVATTADRTVWSIGDREGTAAGGWEAKMYYDKARNLSDTTPTSVVGGFTSTISNTHSMVGAFGAERKQ